MSTINEELLYLEETKQLLKEAIINKGQIITTTDSFRSYVDRINAITTGGGVCYVPEFEVFSKEIGTEFEVTLPKSLFPTDVKKGDICIATCKADSEHMNLITLLSLNQITEAEDDNLDLNCTILNILNNIIDTEEANAQANELIKDKTAYVKGKKVTGNISVADEYILSNNDKNINIDYNEESNSVLITGNSEHEFAENQKYVALQQDTLIGSRMDATLMAESLGITADKIKKAENIIGVEGTYDGVLPEEQYNQAINLANDILGIQENK